MKRLSVFVFYDKDGVVDEYVDYLLDSLTSIIDRLVIVCNGKLNPAGRGVLEKYAKDIIIRDNSGFDGAAYKVALCDYLGRKTVSEYDELLLFNDTFYGPFYSWTSIFDDMRNTECDIWGLSQHGSFLAQEGVKSRHLQSYFLNIRNKVLSSDSFWSFWNDMQVADSFSDAVSMFEVEFSRRMLASGFELKSWLNMPEFDSETPSENFNSAQICCGKAIVDYHFPVIKRKNVQGQDPLNADVYRALEYISKNYDYPMHYIWKSIFRKVDLNAIKNSYGLNQLIGQNDDVGRVAFWIVPTTIEFFNDFFYYYNQIKNYSIIDIFIDSKMKTSLCGVIEEGIYPVFVECQVDMMHFLKENRSYLDNYDFVCIINDTNCATRAERQLMRDYTYGQCVCSKDVMDFVIRFPVGVFGETIIYPELYPQQLTDSFWKPESETESIRSYLLEYGANDVVLDRNCMILGNTTFFITTGFLKEALEFLSDDIQGWYQFLPFLANETGYCLTYRSSDIGCRSLLNKYQIVLLDHMREISAIAGEREQLKQQLGELQKQISNTLAFCRDEDIIEQQLLEKVSLYSYCKLYIYGCGTVAARYASILEKNSIEIEGFIVSDGEKHEFFFRNRPVFEISSLSLDNKCAVLVGVGNRLRPQIEAKLKEYVNTVVIAIDTNYRDFEESKSVSKRRFEIYESIMHQNFLQRLALDAAPFEYGPNHPIMKTSEELLDELISTGKSLVRFGDGEFQLMKNQERPWFQTPNVRLAEKLNEVFYCDKENVIVAIPDILGDLRKYKPEDQANIRYYLKDGVRESLLELVGMNRTYYDAYVSRPYLMYQDSEHGKQIFDKFKRLWQGKHVLLVEGEYMRSGVGNDLFDGVASVKRILCPAQNAFQHYDLIIESVKEHLDGIDLILCGLGPTATVLAYELADTGVQTIDLGQLDNEYEWCQMGATERVPIPGKAVPEIDGHHGADNIEDATYLEQIIKRIYC